MVYELNIMYNVENINKNVIYYSYAILQMYIYFPTFSDLVRNVVNLD